MEKQYLLSVIDKYYLNGLVEKVKWSIKNNVLNVKLISENKDMMGEISANEFDLENDEIAIYNTSQLYKLVNITGQEILLSYKKQHKITTKLLIADNKYNLEYSLSDTLLIPKSPSVNEPEYNSQFNIDKELIDTFIKAKKAISESETVTIESTIDNLSTEIVKFIIGEPNDYSHKIEFVIVAPNSDITVPLKFNSTYIKEIFDNNKDAEIATGYISELGLMKLTFKTTKTFSTYFLTAKE